MNDKEYSNEVKRCEKLFSKWITILGLDRWKNVIHYCREPVNEVHHDGVSGFQYESPMNVKTQWEYMVCDICVSVHCSNIMSDIDLEEMIVHELCHNLIAELRGSPKDFDRHEERVVTSISRILLNFEGTKNKEKEFAIKKLNKEKARNEIHQTDPPNAGEASLSSQEVIPIILDANEFGNNKYPALKRYFNTQSYCP